MSTSASLGQTVWVYRGSMWAYPWYAHSTHKDKETAHTQVRGRRYTSVRVILEDPKYQDWFVSFKPGGSKPDGTWYSEQCDANLKSVCSDRYHNQEQSPGYPHGDGDCEAPGCDCGKVRAQRLSFK